MLYNEMSLIKIPVFKLESEYLNSLDIKGHTPNAMQRDEINQNTAEMLHSRKSINYD